MQNLFTQALGIYSPWLVKNVEFNDKQLNIYIDFKCHLHVRVPRIKRLCKNSIFVVPAKETVQETQRSSFLTPLAPLIRGELSDKSP